MNLTYYNEKISTLENVCIFNKAAFFILKNITICGAGELVQQLECEVLFQTTQVQFLVVTLGLLTTTWISSPRGPDILFWTHWYIYTHVYGITPSLYIIKMIKILKSITAL